MPKTKYILNNKPVLELTEDEHSRAMELLSELQKIYGAERGEVDFFHHSDTGEDAIMIYLATKVHMFPEGSPNYKEWTLDAKWIDAHDLSKCYCSNCNVRFADALRIPLGDILDMPISPTAFCPNCGVRMRGEQDDI